MTARPVLEPVMDPDTLRDLVYRFKAVEFVTVSEDDLDHDLDACSGCPEGLLDPADSEAEFVYEYRGRPCHQPVASCCFEVELNDLLKVGIRPTVRVLMREMEAVA